MENINQLREQLSTVFEDLKNDKIPFEKAKELNNSAGKIIGTLKCEIAYQALRGTCDKIKFLEY